MHEQTENNQKNEDLVVTDEEGNLLEEGFDYVIDAYDDVKRIGDGAETYDDTDGMVIHRKGKEPDVKEKEPQRKFTKAQIKEIRREFLGEVFPEDIEKSKSKMNKKADNRKKNKAAKKQRKVNNKRK